MIFEQLFYDNFCDNIFSHIHIIFSFSLSIILIFVLKSTFIYIFWLSHTLFFVEITFLIQYHSHEARKIIISFSRDE